MCVRETSCNSPRGNIVNCFEIDCSWLCRVIEMTQKMLDNLQLYWSRFFFLLCNRIGNRFNDSFYISIHFMSLFACNVLLQWINNNFDCDAVTRVPYEYFFFFCRLANNCMWERQIFIWCHDIALRDGKHNLKIHSYELSVYGVGLKLFFALCTHMIVCCVYVCWLK